MVLPLALFLFTEEHVIIQKRKKQAAFMTYNWKEVRGVSWPVKPPRLRVAIFCSIAALSTNTRFSCFHRFSCNRKKWYNIQNELLLLHNEMGSKFKSRFSVEIGYFGRQLMGSESEKRRENEIPCQKTSEKHKPSELHSQSENTFCHHEFHWYSQSQV